MAALIVIQCIFAILYLLNHKSTLFAWHARFLYLVVTHTVKFRYRGSESLSQKTLKSDGKDVWLSRQYTSRASMGDLDFNLHKSNSTYMLLLEFDRMLTHIVDLDLARTDFCLQHFPEALIGNFKEHFALGAVGCSFKKEIAPYEQFTMETKLFAWDDKWFWLQTRFLGTKGDTRAHSLAQYVFKRGRKTIAPKIILEACGYSMNESVLILNQQNCAMAREMSRLHELGEAW